MATNATPKRLRSGAWGAQVSSEDVAEGDVITIITRAGKSWQARISRVVWRGDGRAICATEGIDRPSSGSAPSSGSYRPRRGVDYCGYPCPVSGQRCTARNPCHDCE